MNDKNNKKKEEEEEEEEEQQQQQQYTLITTLIYKSINDSGKGNKICLCVTYIIIIKSITTMIMKQTIVVVTINDYLYCEYDNDTR